MKILLTNDDGFDSPGIHALFEALSKIHNVTMIAPKTEKSVVSHSLTLHKPLRIHKISDFHYTTSGTPVDCVYLGINEIMKNDKPDIVISGINKGENLAEDVFFSGTVGAAREGAILGFPSYAVSLAFGKNHKPKKLIWDTAVQALLHVLEKNGKKIPKYTTLNINAPNMEFAKIKGYKETKLGFRRYSSTVIKRDDNRGSPYFWIGGKYLGYDKKVKSSDCDAVEKGFVSVSPLHLDCTNYGYKLKF